MEAVPDKTFGPPYAVINASRLGLRYFRFFLNVSDATKESLIKKLKEHSNVGWVLSATGWCNLGVGVWASNNREIADVSNTIRDTLSLGDSIVYQSELVSLYGFANRPGTPDDTALPILDSTYAPVTLSPLEFDYVKLVTMDNTLTSEQLSELLSVGVSEVAVLQEKLTRLGVVIGSQERRNHTGVYCKFFIDSLSKTTPNAVQELMERLWHEQSCIYIERAIGKYDLEFELVVDDIALATGFLKNFTEHQMIILTDNHYTNLYPLNKTAHVREITDVLSGQKGSVVDLRTSKLWYLNYRGTDSYLTIYNNKEYSEVMNQGELGLFSEIADYVKQDNPKTLYHIIDIGSGDGVKGYRFAEQLGTSSIKAYYPVDIQPIELAMALKSHSEGAYAKHPTLLNIERLDARFPLQLLPGERQVYVFFGGTYGNFSSSNINNYLSPVVGTGSVLLVAMPIISEQQTDEQIILSYTNMKYEDIAFGPLLQVGFNKDDFEESPLDTSLKVHINIEDRRLVSSFVLKKSVTLNSQSFSVGTTFKMVTSWKPTLGEFQAALEESFVIDRMFKNETTAIAAIKAKK